MPTIELDEFVAMLQASVDGLQTAMADRYEARWRELSNLDRGGEIEEVAWLLPAGGEVTWPVPIASSHLEAHVTELTLAFDVAVERRGQRQTPLVTLAVRGSGRRGRTTRHRVEVRLTERQPGDAEILVDGSLLKKFPVEAGNR